MSPKPQDEAKTLFSRSPSPSSSVETKSDSAVKTESQSAPTLTDDSSMPPPDDESASSSTSCPRSPSRSPTPALPIRKPSAATKKKVGPPRQLIGDLPVARDDALATFNELAENNYQNKSIGLSREAMEGMTCECTYKRDNPNACGHGSNCINRLTQIECMPDDCRARSHCQNQRFQRKQYADIQIVLTEKKGFGLRAEDDISKDTFIYEYLGDVVNPVSFKKRMRDYADEGIRHFYFMMLQKDEFIDATKSGGIGRFANHSCNPNCYVAKWTVGAHVRMGIFAKRNIDKYEELTFNYNVDRYGHQAQKCYCGEPQCVGFIGGKTQTDIATVDDLYLDALGITDSAEVMALKGTKKKKGKKLDDPDFLPELRAIQPAEVPTIMQAVRQTQNREMIVKLLTRFHLTTDEPSQREMMRLRCFSLMKNVLEDYASDSEVVTLVLASIRPWPLTVRNKVEDSLIEPSVRAILESEDEKLKVLAQDLLDHWATLTLAYKIPKRVLEPKEEEDEEDQKHSLKPSQDEERHRTPPHARGPSYSHFKRPRLDLYEFARAPPPYLARPRLRTPPPPPPSPPPQRYVNPEPDRHDVAAVIAAAVAQKAADDAAAAAAAQAAAAAAKLTPSKEHKRKHRPPKKAQTPEEKEANKEKRLLKLVGAVVVKCMSKYGKSLERDTFKKHAKELTQLIADKEKKSSSYRDNKLEALSDEKVAKIKKFAKEYIAKVVRKMEKSGHKKRPQPSPSTAQATSSALDTPNSIEGVDVVMTEMTVEEAMDMDPASDSEGEDDGEGDVEMEIDDLTRRPGDGSPAPEPDDARDAAATEMPTSAPPGSDPRRRPPSNGACAWDPHQQTDKLNGVSVVA
ncbi:histone methyltransferase [Mycena maculata]|uniref:Histone-lysine N-methyltransferase, H3 lysine-36 specific n=1 Tax=Mycena maculata TaxID=230809 RepID=A0AAD7HXM0_9AGAR|nr:histone methyltransferase [Mycena maculata]